MTADKTDYVPEEYNYDCIMDTIGDEFFLQLKKRLNLAKTDPEWQAANGYFKFVLQSPDKRYRYRDYFMIGERVRFLFTSCEGSLNERVSAANE